MIRTKEMYAGGFYLFQGQSAANSSFIEDKEEAVRFIKTCNSKFNGYLIIHDFLLTKDGWQLLVELNDEEAILTKYEESRQNSRKVKSERKLEIVWKIISEQLRGILSNFVVYTNRKNGRTGSKVARSYERFWFETCEEGEQHLLRMRKQLVRMSQRLRKYRPGKNHYRIPKSLGRGAFFLCSLQIKKGQEIRAFGEGCLELIHEKLDVVRHLINSTIILHISHNSSGSIIKLE